MLYRIRTEMNGSARRTAYSMRVYLSATEWIAVVVSRQSPTYTTKTTKKIMMPAWENLRPEDLSEALSDPNLVPPTIARTRARMFGMWRTSAVSTRMLERGTLFLFLQ